MRSPSPPPGGADLDGLPLDHIGVATSDLAAAAAPWRALGYAAEPDVVIEEQRVRVRVLAPAGTAHAAGVPRIELLEPQDADGPVGRFLARRGPGLHHLALRTLDLDAEIARLQALGARFVDARPRRGLHGSRVVFLHPSWGGGVLLELVEPAAP